MITTTLNRIRACGPCTAGWEKLLHGLGKTKADNELLPLERILDINGLEDALWALRAVEGHDQELRLLACRFACQVARYAPDQRVLRCVEAAALYVDALADEEELAAAWDAARDAARAAARAAWDAARDAARAAAWVARAAAWAAEAAWAAAWAARAAAWAAEAAWAARAAAWATGDAGDAARAAVDAEKEWRVEEFRRFCCGDGYEPLGVE